MSRIDYLLVGGTANVQDARSEVRPDVDNGSPNEDHQSAALHLRGALGKGGSARPRFDLGRLNTETGKRVLEEAHHDRSKPPFIPDEAWALRQQKCQLRWRTKARHGMWRQLLSDAWDTWGRWKRTSHGHGNLAAETRKQLMLYDLIAVAVKLTTYRIRELIAEAKDNFLLALAKDGPQDVASIMQRAKKAGIGAKVKKPIGRELPKLLNPEDGTDATADRDATLVSRKRAKYCPRTASYRRRPCRQTRSETTGRGAYYPV